MSSKLSFLVVSQTSVDNARLPENYKAALQAMKVLDRETKRIFRKGRALSADDRALAEAIINGHEGMVKDCNRVMARAITEGCKLLKDCEDLPAMILAETTP